MSSTANEPLVAPHEVHGIHREEEDQANLVISTVYVSKSPLSSKALAQRVQKAMWLPPRLIRGEEMDPNKIGEIERSMTWSELFYDLIFGASRHQRAITCDYRTHFLVPRQSPLLRRWERSGKTVNSTSRSTSSIF